MSKIKNLFLPFLHLFVSNYSSLNTSTYGDGKDTTQHAYAKRASNSSLDARWHHKMDITGSALSPVIVVLSL